MKNKPKRVRGLYPRGQELQYQREVLGLVNSFLSPIMKRAKASYLGIKNQYERETNLKRDAYSDRLEKLNQAMDIIVTQKLSDKKLKEIARRRGMAVNKYNIDQLRRQVKAVASVDIFSGQDKWLKPVMESFVAENVSLIQNVGAQTLKRVQTTVSMGVQRGWTLKKLTQELQKTSKFSKNRAKLIARDQVATLNGQLTKVRHQDAGINKYIWSTSLDERVRHNHRTKEGRIYSWNNPPDDTGHPGEDINCRCVALPVIEI